MEKEHKETLESLQVSIPFKSGLSVIQNKKAFKANLFVSIPFKSGLSVIVVYYDSKA